MKQIELEQGVTF